jgi:hypothetical protein
MNKTILALVAAAMLYVLFFRRTGEGYTPLRAAWRYALRETSPNSAKRVSGPFDRCSPEEWPCK